MRGAGVISTHPLAAIDIVCLRHDIVAFLGGKKDRAAEEVLWPCHPAEWHPLADPPLLFPDREAFVLREEGVDTVPVLALDYARRDGVDVDPMLDEVQPGRLREAYDGRLRSTVDSHQRFTSPARLARHVDDLATLPALNHVPRYSLHREQHAMDIHGEQFLIAGRGDLDDRRQIKQRRVIDQDVDLPVLMNDLAGIWNSGPW